MSTIATPLGTQNGDETRSKIIKLRDAARSMRDFKLVERDVDRSERAYRGQIYSDVDRADGRDYIQNPFAWEMIARFMPILMAQKPAFTMAPVDEENELLVKQATIGGDYLWRDQRMDKMGALWAKRAMKTGTSFLYTGVEHLFSGDKCFTKLINYRNVFPDPAATDDEDWTYCFIHVRLTLDQIVSLYGESGLRLIHDKGLKPTAPPRETVGGMLPGQPGATSYARAGTAATIASGSTYNEQLIRSPQGTQGEDMRYNVWELFLHDRSEMEVEDELDDGEKVMVRLQTHERPRWITMIEDHYDPELDRESERAHGQIPVIRLAADDDDGEFWGGGLIRPLTDTIEQISDLQNIMTNAARVCGSPWWKVGTDSGIKVDTIEGDAGMVLPVNPGTVCEMIAPPQMPTYLADLWNRMLNQAQNASGISESVRGNIGGLGEGTSGKAIQLAQDPFFARMRMFQLGLEIGFSKWGHQSISNLIQDAGDAWWQRRLPARLMGQGFAWQGWTEDDIRDMPGVIMTAGSNLPADKTQKATLALALFNAGAFDPMKPEPARRELLKAADWPDYEQVCKAVTASMPAPMPGMLPGQPAPPPGPNKAVGGDISPEAALAVRANPDGQEP